MDKKPVKNKNREFYLFALRITGDFGATIAIPVVLFVYIGRKLDNYYHYSFLFTILAFVLAALLSGLVIYRKAKLYGNEFQNLIGRKSP